jgi:F420-dependent oxidoreductase-like protein
MELGLHLANFTWNGGAQQLARTLGTAAGRAEEIGMARVTVMDHVWQIPGVGPAENDMLDPYTALGFIAAHTKKALLHVLVTSTVYRAPAILAKSVTTLDVLSGGRAGLGIGAAWNEEESKGMGLSFPPLKERFERLEETVQICLQLWAGDESPYRGAHYTLERPLNVPQSLSRPHPYLMIGGSGEKKTLRMVAQYADACNLFTSPELPQKIAALKGHCDDLGRDYDTIEKTTTVRIVPETTRDSLLKDVEVASANGFTVTYIMPNVPDPLKALDLIESASDDLAAL